MVPLGPLPLAAHTEDFVRTEVVGDQIAAGALRPLLRRLAARRLIAAEYSGTMVVEPLCDCDGGRGNVIYI